MITMVTYVWSIHVDFEQTWIGRADERRMRHHPVARMGKRSLLDINLESMEWNRNPHDHTLETRSISADNPRSRGQPLHQRHQQEIPSKHANHPAASEPKMECRTPSTCNSNR